jgi:hypothetical protein
VERLIWLPQISRIEQRGLIYFLENKFAPFFSLIAEIKRATNKQQFDRDNPVIAVFKGLHEYVTGFESNLDDDHEVGARLITFAQSIQIHVQNIGYKAPFF